MNFLADESVDRQIVDRLRQDEHLVWYVAEMEPGVSIVTSAIKQHGAELPHAFAVITSKVFRIRRSSG